MRCTPRYRHPPSRACRFSSRKWVQMDDAILPPYGTERAILFGGPLSETRLILVRKEVNKVVVPFFTHGQLEALDSHRELQTFQQTAHEAVFYRRGETNLFYCADIKP